MTPITDPTAVADQLKAAADQVRRGVERVRAAGELDVTETTPTPWLASQLAQLRDAINAGTARACPHLHGGPRVVVAAAWSPGILVCQDCTPALQPGPDEDTTCDRCRQHAPVIHPAVAAFEHLLLTYGLCPQCAQTEDRAAARRDETRDETRPRQLAHHRSNRPRRKPANTRARRH